MDTRCTKHGHPSLAHPIPVHRLRAELGELLARTGIHPPSVTLVVSDRLGRIHARNARRYAEVRPAPAEVHVAPQILSLPEANRWGVLAHEVGHLFVGGGTEPDADRAALDVLGVKIGYDRRWPGRGLQRALP